MQAPTGSNRQGWRWIVVTDPVKRQALAEIYRKGAGSYLTDALAASASLVQGETDQGQPVVWADGCHLRLTEQASAQQLLRPLEQDMFR